jgi:hypothetical protein
MPGGVQSQLRMNSVGGFDVARPATARPASQPGARPPAGALMAPASIPQLAISQDVTEFEFHISPVSSSSRPQTGVGTDGTRLEGVAPGGDRR